MKRVAVFALCPLFVLALTLAAWAAGPVPGAADPSPDQVIYDAPAAFQFLMSMAGDWTRGGAADHEHGNTGRAVNFKVAAAGSAVVETLYAGQPSEMVTVFHWNGDELLMTHYCALQNAPIMKFQKSDKPGEIKFVFHGGTNFDPAVDTHVHEGEFKVRDGNTVESNFTSFEGGKAKPQGKALLHRKPAN